MYLVADFDKILKKHDGFEATQFIEDSLYKSCVSEVFFFLQLLNLASKVSVM
jgi:hypothetical protein